MISEIIQFLNNWQNLIGAMIGAFIAIFGSVIVTLYLRHREKVSERKKQYANLILILHDIQIFISRCETYLGFRNQGTVSFNKIVINDKLNYIEASQIFDLDPEVCNSVQKIYNVANVIKNNLDLSEVKQTFQLKTAKENIPNFLTLPQEDVAAQDSSVEWEVQDSIICKRYWNGLSFVEHYLEDVYRNFNFVAIHVRRLSKKYRYLTFPRTIKLYTHNHVEEAIQKYKLKKGKIEG